MDKLELTFKQKIELAKCIADHNGGAITGSLMLKARGVDLGRECDDIDIILETLNPVDVWLPPFCEKVEEGEDNEGYTVLARAMFFGNKIEFITVDKVISDIIYSQELATYLKLAKIEDLIEAKEYYLKHDINAEYLQKTKRDLEILYKHLKKRFIN